MVTLCGGANQELLFCVSFIGALAVGADIFHEGDNQRLFTFFNCAGNESNLLQCDKTVFNGINCPTSGVICQGRVAFS